MLEAGTPAFVEALDQAVIALMIEKDPAVENLEDLLSVDGVDMVQFGPADYAMSIGLAGQLSHPRVREAEEHVISTALRMRIAPRAELRDREGAERYLDMGVKHFCVGTDVRILSDWFKDAGAGMLDLLGRDPPGRTNGSDSYR